MKPSYRPESQLCSGMHQKQHDQQGKRAVSPTLFCFGESPPGVLHPSLGSSAQEKHEPVIAGPEESCENDHKDGTPLQLRRTEGVGAVWSGEEKAPGRPL